MAAKNDITGDTIQTKTPSDAYRDNYDRIFRKDKQPELKNEYYDILSTKDCFDSLINNGPDA